jgi:hypothetical protein
MDFLREMNRKNMRGTLNHLPLLHTLNKNVFVTLGNGRYDQYNN